MLIRELLFADDAGLAAHTEAALQRLIDCFAAACADNSMLTTNTKIRVY